MPAFPNPRHLGANCTRWPLSALLQYEAARNGEPTPQLSPDAERYLTADEVAARYSVGKTTVWRWARESAERRAAA